MAGEEKVNRFRDNNSRNTDLSNPSDEGGAQKLTIASSIAQGSNQECRSILVVHGNDSAVYMNVGGTADANDFYIPKNVPIPAPFDNCNKLHFYGTNGAVIRLLWRN